jgi:TPR repeat protein
MFYRRAAEAGLAEAAFALATTYDPDELGRLKVVGLRSDPAIARHWYERAHALGFKGADDRLSRLGAR